MGRRRRYRPGDRFIHTNEDGPLRIIPKEVSDAKQAMEEDALPKTLTDQHDELAEPRA